MLTNQCLGKETNAEPPGQGTEGSLFRLTDSDKLVVERFLGSHPAVYANNAIALVAPL